MKQDRVLNRSHIPTHFPALSSCVAYLMLDHFASPAWLWGVVGTIFAFLWIGCGIKLYNEVPISPPGFKAD